LRHINITKYLIIACSQTHSKKLYIHNAFQENYYIVGIKNVKKSKKNLIQISLASDFDN